MTKLRPPLSFAQAVTRIAARIGWEAAAEAVGKSERTVRNWSDPDTGTHPSIDDALTLDGAYIADGGGEAPLLNVYALRLDIHIGVAPGPDELTVAAAEIAREGGEAVAALITAAHPTAGPRERAVAEREVEQNVQALQRVLRQLHAPPRLSGESPTGREG